MNVTHERNHALQERLRGEKLLTRAIAAELEQPWRANGVIAQAVFFGLALLAFGAFYAMFAVFQVPRPGLFTGVVAIIVAEYLIRAERWFGTGVEAALWIGGLVALISELPRSGTPESILVIGAAFVVAGVRVRNPLFGAAATICVVHYLEDRFDLGVIAALLFATAALIALLRTWRRPSNEWLWIAIALICPLAGIVYADEEWRVVTMSLYALFAVIAFALAIARKHHAYLLAAMIGISVAATELAQMFPAVALEAKLALGGALLLGVAFIVSRALRGHTKGFVLTPAKLTPIDDQMQLAATLAAPHAGAPHGAAPETHPGGGGSFGGAGASGDY
ncbi:MAG TPA: hypothetical protein VF911_09515 [Thermoanaerobaculia bacterium]|jgi:hypothetical protein